MLDFRPTRSHEYRRPNLWLCVCAKCGEPLTPSLKTIAAGKHSTIGRDCFMGR